MSDNPYSGTYQAEIYTEPERTSVAAVFSLICSLVCCIPGVSLLGAVLGLVALLGIGRSRGRVGGRGLAIAGIVLGLLFTLLWVGIAIGTNQGLNYYVKTIHPAVGGIFEDLDAGRYDEVRAAMGGWIAGATDEELAAFRDAYTPGTGGFVSPAPQTTSEMFGLFGEHGQAFQSVQGRQNMIPVLLAFDSGVTLAGVDFDPTRERPDPGPINELPLVDLWVIGPDGTLYEMSDYVSRQPPAPTPAPEITPEATPEAGDAGADQP